MTRDRPGVIAPPPLIALATLLIGLGFDRLFPSSLIISVLSPGQRLALGLALAGLGAACSGLGIAHFRHVGTHVEPWKPALHLASGGIYRHTRNPMYLGLGLAVAGIAVASGSDWTLAWLLPAALVLHFGVVLREERYLEQKFGDAYRRYQQRVPRYGWR